MSFALHNPRFYGTHLLRFDAKQRVTLPTKWKASAPDCPYYMAWVVGPSVIRVYPAQYLERFAGTQRPELESEVAFAITQRRIFGSAFTLVPDQQRRMTLDPELVKACPLESEIALVGEGERFSILNAKDLDRVPDDEEADFFKFFRQLESYRHEK